MIACYSTLELLASLVPSNKLLKCVLRLLNNDYDYRERSQTRRVDFSYIIRQIGRLKSNNASKTQLLKSLTLVSILIHSSYLKQQKPPLI